MEDLEGGAGCGRLERRWGREYPVGVRAAPCSPITHARGLDMKLAASVSFAFLIGSVFLAAQNPGPSPAPTTTTARAQKMNISCPVRLRALHGADGSIVKVDKDRPKGIAQLLHLILTSPDSRQIVEARLRVRGTSGKGRVTQTATAGDGSDAVRNLVVQFTPGPEKEVARDVWVPGMSAVLGVELNSVTFDDGTTLRFGAAHGCRFTPDHLMLIADR